MPEMLRAVIAREVSEGRIHVTEAAPCSCHVYSAITGTGSLLGPGEQMTVHTHAQCQGYPGMCDYCLAFGMITPNLSDNGSICGACLEASQPV